MRWLPWGLLGLSILLNALLWPSPDSPVVLTKPSTLLAPKPSAPEPEPTPPRARALSSDEPRPYPESLTYRAYIDLLARHLKTAEQRLEINRVLSRWIVVDPEAASQWLNDHQTQAIFDPAVRAAVLTLVTQENFAIATEWAHSIQSPEERVEAFASIYLERFRRGELGPAQVRASGLPRETITAILDGSALD